MADDCRSTEQNHALLADVGLLCQPADVSWQGVDLAGG